jgi:hypothetical protein
MMKHEYGRVYYIAYDYGDPNLDVEMSGLFGTHVEANNVREV